MTIELGLISFHCCSLYCPIHRSCNTRHEFSLHQVLVTLRSFDPARLRPRNCAFHPQGTLLSIGFTSGACKILDATDLEEVASFRYSSASLSAVRFSPDGEMVRPAQPFNRTQTINRCSRSASGRRCLKCRKRVQMWMGYIFGHHTLLNACEILDPPCTRWESTS